MDIFGILGLDYLQLGAVGEFIVTLLIILCIYTLIKKAMGLIWKIITVVGILFLASILWSSISEKHGVDASEYIPPQTVQVIEYTQLN